LAGRILREPCHPSEQPSPLSLAQRFGVMKK
jgi:hypothetical protein